MPYQSINPTTSKVLKTFKELTNPQLEKAIKTAAACFESWRHMAPASAGHCEILYLRPLEGGSTPRHQTRALTSWGEDPIPNHRPRP